MKKSISESIVNILNKAIDKLMSKKNDVVSTLKENIMDPEVDGYHEFTDFDLDCERYLFEYKGGIYLLDKEYSLCKWVKKSHELLAKSMIDRLENQDKEVLSRVCEVTEETSSVEWRMFIVNKYSGPRLSKLKDHSILDTSIEFDYNGDHYILDYQKNDEIDLKKKRFMLPSLDIRDKDMIIALYPDLKDGVYKIPTVGYPIYLKRLEKSGGKVNTKK